MTARLISSVSTVLVSERMKAAIVALLFGAFFVWGAGLANSQVLHEGDKISNDLTLESIQVIAVLDGQVRFRLRGTFDDSQIDTEVDA